MRYNNNPKWYLKKISGQIRLTFLTSRDSTSLHTQLVRCREGQMVELQQVKNMLWLW